MRKLGWLVVAGLLAMPAAAGDVDYRTPDRKQLKLMRDAEKVLHASVNAPDKGIPQDLLARAECVGVFPGVKKGAFVVGGEFGRGVFTCRKSDGTMGAPAFFTLGGPSVGWQFGGRSADMVLLIMNEEGVNNLLKDKFTLGGEASVAAGPVGRTAEAATDARLRAQILSWSRSRGAFLGAALEGMVLKPDKKALEAFYGPSVTARQILVDQSVSVPTSAKPFVRSTSEVARRAS